MKKITIIVTAIFSALTLASSASAQGVGMQGMMGISEGTPSPSSEAHGASLDEALQGIMALQGVARAADIDCEKVGDDQWETLGDAVMGLMHPDERQHELMDQMMGGEGSQSLQAAHIYMGQQYLGCGGYGGYGMMGGGMMRGGMGMMGNGMPVLSRVEGMGGLLNQDDAADQNYHPAYRMMYGGHQFGWDYGAAHWVTVVLVWAFLVLGIIALIRNIIK